MAIEKMPDAFEKARADIFAAHNEDPNKTTIDGKEVPYEVHYAQQMEAYLAKREPKASEVLRLAICAQHFRRWEVPRSDFPMTKVGYHTWRTHLKKRQAQQVGEILDLYYPVEETRRCMALIEKEGLRQGEPEVCALEDSAVLTFLDDQFAEFRTKHDEQKVVNILRKTWGKMSPRGQELALQIPMIEECKALVQKALAE